MRIAIDAFNLALKQGTGIATYARDLSHILTAGGHELFPIYGLNAKTSDPAIAAASFVQSLSIRGEVSRKDVVSWAQYTLRYLPYYLSRVPLMAQEVPIPSDMGFEQMAERMPSYAKLFNIPSLYRVSQAYARFSTVPLNIGMPVKTDILHLTFPLPIKMPGVKLAVSVLDLIPLVLPHSTEINLKHYRNILLAAINHADVIFTLSECSKRDILRHFPFPEEKIVVTYLAIKAQKSKVDAAEAAQTLLRTYQLKHGAYFLYFGAIEPRKNVARLIDAMSAAKTDMPLVIVGKDGWLYQDVTAKLKSADPQRIKRLSYVPKRDLDFLIHGARGVVFPSLYEGFGLPVLEAMQAGCPVITSNVSSLPEVCGDAALMINPYNISEMAQAIDRLATDDDLRERLIAAGTIQSAKFSESVYLEKLNQGYQLAMKGRKPYG